MGLSHLRRTVPYRPYTRSKGPRRKFWGDDPWACRKFRKIPYKELVLCTFPSSDRDGHPNPRSFTDTGKNRRINYFQFLEFSHILFFIFTTFYSKFRNFLTPTSLVVFRKSYVKVQVIFTIWFSSLTVTVTYVEVKFYSPNLFSQGE